MPRLCARGRFATEGKTWEHSSPELRWLCCVRIAVSGKHWTAITCVFPLGLLEVNLLPLYFHHNYCACQEEIKASNSCHASILVSVTTSLLQDSNLGSRALEGPQGTGQWDADAGWLGCVAWHDVGASHPEFNHCNWWDNCALSCLMYFEKYIEETIVLKGNYKIIKNNSKKTTLFRHAVGVAS